MPKWGALVEFLVAVSAIIFNTQFAVYSNGGERQYYRQLKGVSTGLACGSQIANMFLEALDRSYAASFSADTALYMRYIDDIIIICRVSLDCILVCLNDFDVSIHVTHEDSENGNVSSFLDLLYRYQR